MMDLRPGLSKSMRRMAFGIGIGKPLIEWARGAPHSGEGVLERRDDETVVCKTAAMLHPSPWSTTESMKFTRTPYTEKLERPRPRPPPLLGQIPELRANDALHEGR